MAGPWWQSGARGRRIEEMSTSWLRRTLVDREVEILSADHDEEFRTQFAAWRQAVEAELARREGGR